MIYRNEGKNYEVESVNCNGMCIEVNGTTITDCDLQAEIFEYKHYKFNGSYSVFMNGEELLFSSFEKAYKFAMERC